MIIIKNKINAGMRTAINERIAFVKRKKKNVYKTFEEFKKEQNNTDYEAERVAAKIIIKPKESSQHKNFFKKNVTAFKNNHKKE